MSINIAKTVFYKNITNPTVKVKLTEIKLEFTKELSIYILPILRMSSKGTSQKNVFFKMRV